MRCIDLLQFLQRCLLLSLSSQHGVQNDSISVDIAQPGLLTGIALGALNRSTSSSFGLWQTTEVQLTDRLAKNG